MERFEQFSSFESASRRAKELSASEKVTVKIVRSEDGSFQLRWMDRASGRVPSEESLSVDRAAPSAKGSSVTLSRPARRRQLPFYKRTYWFSNGYGQKRPTNWLGALLLTITLVCLPLYLLFNVVLLVVWLMK